MLTFLFWNTYRNRQDRLKSALRSLADEYLVDVLILAENAIVPHAVLTTLNYGGASDFDFSSTVGCKKIQIYCRFPHQYLTTILEDDRTTSRELELPDHASVLLVALHAPSKNNYHESLGQNAGDIRDFILEAERLVGHRRTVVVGDFNMNPFEHGMVGAGGLHAVMTRALTQKESRTVLGREHIFMYNPMWSLFGDASRGPAGSYYDYRSEHVCYFWNMFDQVLIRPDLLSSFSQDDLIIATAAGDESLIKADGTPDTNLSDHLPLIFRLRL